jgi:hypothetical protein
MRLWSANRTLLSCTFLVASVHIASAESQLAPFFAGLRTIQTVEARKSYIDAERRSPDALVLSEELPTLREALADSDALISYLAGGYLSYLVQRQGRDPELRESLRAAAAAMAAHFGDTNPDPYIEIGPLGSGGSVKEDRWQQVVLNFLDFANLPMPAELIPAVESTLNGPYFDGAIRELAKLKPLPEEVLRELLTFMQNAPDPRKGRVMNWLSRYGCTDPRFVQAIIGILSSSHKDLYPIASLAAATVGPAASSAIPALRRIATEEKLFEASFAIDAITKGTTPSRIDTAEPAKESTDKSKAADPESLRVASYFELLKNSSENERQKLIVNDLKAGITRLLVPAEDLPFLMEELNGNDRSLAALSETYLVAMAGRNIGAGAKIRELIASALPAMAAHYDDQGPTAIAPQFLSGGWRTNPMRLVSLTRTPPPPDLVKRFVSALDDDSTAGPATGALLILKPLPGEVLKAILAKLRGASENVRFQLTNLLQSSVEDPALALTLGAILDDPLTEHYSAAAALYQMGTAARPAEPALRRFVAGVAPPKSLEDAAKEYAETALRHLEAK